MADSEDGLFVMLVGRPADSDWDAMMAAFVDVMLAAGRTLGLREAAAQHRRGAHSTIGDGVSFGGGRVVGVSCTAALIRLTIRWSCSDLVTSACQL